MQVRYKHLDHVTNLEEYCLPMLSSLQGQRALEKITFQASIQISKVNILRDMVLHPLL